MVFKIFAREGCDVCIKARDVLGRLGVPVEVCYVDGANATVENVADLAWFDWTDTPPLVVVTEGNKVLARWTGDDIAAARSWHKAVERWLEAQRSTSAGA